MAGDTIRYAPISARPRFAAANNPATRADESIDAYRISNPDRVVNNPNITGNCLSEKPSCSSPMPIKINPPSNTGNGVPSNQFCASPARENVVSIINIAVRSINGRPKGSRVRIGELTSPFSSLAAFCFSDLNLNSGKLSKAIPNTVHEIHPATSLTADIASDHSILTNINIPIYWMASSAMLMRQSVAINRLTDVIVTRSRATIPNRSSSNFYLPMLNWAKREIINVSSNIDQRIPPRPSNVVLKKVKICPSE